ncbi:hypothetical protein [Glaciecola sp. KUL10]|uniref:hypothetical protein n=1 Tax=Glaciecola sp. (strain KUL10) TaxID=2161813 RepID=UPI000D787316|nr:hypothetical protein [Glaciecola sp. KUL10]
MKILLHLIASALACFVVASLLHTQSVLNRLIELGINIPISNRISTVFADLQGLAPTYGVILLAGLSIAFFVSSLLLKRFSTNPIIIYSIAGAVAVATILLAMQPILNITLLGGARGTFGFLSQCLAGALGGILFGALRTQRKN